MATHQEKTERFLALHGGPEPLLLPNAWDQGTAKIFAALGFDAIATTSAGHAGTLGRRGAKHVTAPRPRSKQSDQLFSMPFALPTGRPRRRSSTSFRLIIIGLRRSIWRVGCATNRR